MQHTRHYLGNYFYENDTLQHRRFGDGRIVYNPDEYGYEYHYYHKDHLGNIRQVFRAESTTTYMATMEPENETQEMQQFFHNLSDSRSIDARYNQTEGGRAVAYLDASRGRDYGPVWSKELAQGDSLHAAVLGMLYDPKEKPKLKEVLTGIGRQNTLRTGLEGANLTSTSSLGLQPLWLALQLARQLEKAPVPESYLGYILYDQDSIRYDSGRVEISRQAFTNPEELALDITASQGGFVEVYVYNSSDLPVWYDQFSISSSQAVIIQENHYYPFGMQIAGLELDLDSKNRYLYNGKELQDDHNLDWHDYGARMYDAQIGRFHTVDRFSEKYLDFSPYQYAANNPILYIDVNGDSINVNHMNSQNQASLVQSLSNATGLNLTVDDNGNLEYSKRKGKAEINRDAYGKKTGSKAGRKALTKAIDDEKKSLTVTDQVTESGSFALIEENIINLDPTQISENMSNVNGISSEVIGWGMTFFHEFSHTAMGGRKTDPNSQTVGNDPLGGAVRFTNTIRRQLGYSQRTQYSLTLGNNSNGARRATLHFSKGTTHSIYPKDRGGLKIYQYGQYLQQNGIVK